MSLHAVDAKHSIIAKQTAALSKSVRHGIRNELHAISLGLGRPGLYSEEIKAGLISEAESTFDMLQQLIRKLDTNASTRLRNDAKHQNSKVFAISGPSPEDNGLNTGPTGVDQWFYKPLNLVSLVEAFQINDME